MNIVLETGKYNALTVSDISGKVLQHIQLNTSENHLTISLGSYPAGTYLIRLNGNEDTEVRKIVKR